MEGQRPDHTLQTTAVAAKAMRQVLVDHARAQQRQKRGAGLPLVYAWTGERGRALEQLEKVATLPGEGAPTTHGDLRFNPCCDDLRGDKRFDKIVAAAKAASRSFVTGARK